MDPLSIVTSVTSLITVVAQLSKAICELVNNINDCPSEIEAVSNDIRNFYNIMLSLEGGLEILKADQSNSLVPAALVILQNPLRNCQFILEELMAKIRKSSKPLSRCKMFRLKWSLQTKHEIEKLQARLERAKATLTSALNVCQTLYSLNPVNRSFMAMGSTMSEPFESGAGSTTTNGDSIYHELEIEPRFGSSTSIDVSTTFFTEEPIIVSSQEVLASVSAVIRQTRLAFAVAHRRHQRSLADIYKQLGKECRRMQRIQSRLDEVMNLNDHELEASVSDVISPVSTGDYGDNSEDMGAKDSTSIDIFYDCVSRFATDDSETAIKRLELNFSGSIDWPFESSSSFFAEQYTVEGLFGQPFFVVAMKQSVMNNYCHQYFITYPQTPRRWRKIIVLATVSTMCAQSTFARIFAATDNENSSFKMVPYTMQKVLAEILPRLHLFNSVSRLSLRLKEDLNGGLTVESPGAHVTEDLMENNMRQESSILRNMKHLHCEIIEESNIFVKSRISSTCYEVTLNGKHYVEQQTPFATSGSDVENSFEIFLQDLKLLISLRGCPGVVQFAGIVVDATRTNLRGYLYESPAIIYLSRFFTVADTSSILIPWKVREGWARQIAYAVSKVHSKAHIVGVIDFKSIGLRADGTAVLTRLKTSYRHLVDEKGFMPPELRGKFGADSDIRRRHMDFATDIFQLGYIFWLLAEHKPYVDGYLCAKSACAAFPRIKCTASHANPVELPACCGEIPTYFTEIIRSCRLTDPKMRPSAQEILKSMPFEGEVSQLAVELVTELSPQINSLGVYCNLHCDECGEPSRDLHYHCNICSFGDFDLCAHCFTQGVGCFNSTHTLMKRIMRNGTIITII